MHVKDPAFWAAQKMQYDHTAQPVNQSGSSIVIEDIPLRTFNDLYREWYTRRGYAACEQLNPVLANA